ncbi:MAG: M23 family metallopeptidase [Oscillospiraceae bacterium]|nr:M23 family metallopeptidase [Oscillospiraceae bacterium]
MNKKFFTNMREQIEPSEQLVCTLHAKIAAQTAPKPANSFVKWLPLTAAACVMIAVMVLILPALMSAPPDVPFAADETPDYETPFIVATPDDNTEGLITITEAPSGEYCVNEMRELVEQALREIYGDDVRFIINFDEIPDSLIEDLYQESGSDLINLTDEQLERILEQVYRKLPPNPDELIIEGVTFVWPLPREYEVSEWHWSDGGYFGHSGIDFDAPLGTPIFAADSGEVTQAEWVSAFGNMITIKHENGLATRYAHCSELLVSEGDFVEQGEIIAYVGATGRADRTQLHFEVRYNERILNPRHYLDFD